MSLFDALIILLPFWWCGDGGPRARGSGPSQMPRGAETHPPAATPAETRRGRGPTPGPLRAPSERVDGARTGSRALRAEDQRWPTRPCCPAPSIRLARLPALPCSSSPAAARPMRSAGLYWIGLVSGLPAGRNHEPCDKAYCGPTRRISGGAGFSRPAYGEGARLDSVPDLPEWLYRAALRF
jgi:hypothetical protein